MFPILAPNQDLLAFRGASKTDQPSKSVLLDNAEQVGDSSKYLSRDDMERIVEDLFEYSNVQTTMGSKLARESGH